MESLSSTMTRKRKNKLESRIGTYICQMCEEVFFYAEPCEHDEKIRADNLAKFDRIERELNEMLENGSDPDIDPYKLWEIANRLMYIKHVKYGN